MTYEAVSKLAQQGGTLYFFAMFCVALIYALWPKKKEEFDHAARLPLDEED